MNINKSFHSILRKGEFLGNRFMFYASSLWKPSIMFYVLVRPFPGNGSSHLLSLSLRNFAPNFSFHQADDGQIEFPSPSSSKPASPSWIGEREIWVKFSAKTID